MSRVDRTETYLNTLPLAHQELLHKYRDNLHRVRNCIDENYQIIRKLIEDVGNMFENANQSVLPNPNQNRNEEACVRTQDLDKVNVLSLSFFSFFFFRFSSLDSFMRYLLSLSFIFFKKRKKKNYHVMSK